MFYEVRIYNAKGKLKQVVPPKKASQRYWENFYNVLKDESLRPQVKRNGKSVPGFRRLSKF